MKTSIFKNVHQIGIVTHDARATICNYINKYGIGPWNLWEFGPEIVEDMQVNGKRADYRMIVATCKSMNVDFEIIEPLDSVSIYHDFLSVNGEGIHHINYDVADYEIAVSFFKKKDIAVTQFGNLLGKHRYIYFDTERDAGHIIETSGDLPGLKRKEPQEVLQAKGGNHIPDYKKILQIGILVKDVNDTAQKLNDIYNIGPWNVHDFTFKEMQDMGIIISETDFCYRIATCMIKDVELVLLQPLETTCIFKEVINQNYSGACFISFEVCDYEKSLKIARDTGVEITRSGKWHGKKFSFLDTRRDLKFTTCIIKDTGRLKNNSFWKNS